MICLKRLPYLFCALNLVTPLLDIYKTAPRLILNSFLTDNSINLTVGSLDFYKMSFILKYHFNYLVSVDFFAVDFAEREFRFDLILLLRQQSLKNSFLNLCGTELTLLILRTVAEQSSPVNTVSNVFQSIIWLEREIWDCFGIFFLNHPDFRRILMDYGFEGFPFRKDFPLSGYTEIRYDAAQQRIVLEPIELTQEFRFFDFSNPWISL